MDTTTNPLHFVWLEITGKCQLSCTHCYAESGPTGTHGTMTGDDWRRVIDQAADLGVRLVQFIGGEPTMHPDLPGLVDHALQRRVEVEVFSNLVHVDAELWDTFTRPGVRLATSFYSDNPDQHAEVTKRRGSHARTKANIAEALRRSIPLRVGVAEVSDGQRVTQAQQQLAALGVTQIDTDHLRQVGRGVRTQAPDVSQLCGACARGKVAVSPTGEVWPCVFARWMPIGNVRSTPLAEIVTDDRMDAVLSQLDALPTAKCNPDKNQPKCDPATRCDPSKSPCQPHCPPGYHSKPKRCWPHYYDAKK
jgi:MoaA/NifB/PqqE/SkfB family radical SAM enzyme